MAIISCSNSLYQQHLFCGISLLPRTTIFVALPYSNNIPVVAKKSCNILIHVEITKYYNGQKVCGDKLLRQCKRFMAIVYSNKTDYGGATFLSQHAERMWL
jgi:hypothetical protein